jgi:hypothetical protein
MRCQTCDYPLWNLRSRTCPECGAPFLPSAFDFVPNSVRFCCPDCGQDYYGTSERGHLVPDSFNCVKCGRATRMDEMVLLPTEGVREEQTRVDVVPWLDRSRVGFLKGWLGTIWMVLFKPGRLAAALPTEGGLGSAAWFALLTSTLFGLLGGTIFFVPLLLSGAGAGGLFAAAGPLIGFVIGVPITVITCLAIWSAAAHGLLRITGKTSHGISRTAICFCYASAAGFLAAIPCLGIYFVPVTWVWPSIAGAVMLTRAQRVSGVRASFASVTAPLVVSVSVVALFVVMISSLRGSLTTAYSAVMTARAPAATTSVTSALRAYAAANNGAEPPHALALLADNHVILADLYLQGMPMTPAETTVASFAVADVPGMQAPERSTAVLQAARTLPPGTIAHRLGDMVFVYHGIDLAPASSADPSLWLVVCAPTPQAPPGSVQTINVGTLGGAVLTISTAQWSTSLDEQNAIRMALGLPALPDPMTVMQSAPAVAGSGG